jgi:hypothetical protein
MVDGMTAARLTIVVEVTVQGFGPLALEAVRADLVEGAASGVLRTAHRLIPHRGVGVGTSSTLDAGDELE